MADGGWIKLYRVLLDDDLWIDCTPVQKVVMITLLLMANHKERKWIWQGKKFVAKPGQMVTSLESIKQEAGKGVSIKNVRSSLDKFQKVGFLANQSAKTGRLITIANWAKYQDGVEEVAKQQANNWQTGGKQVATNKNVKNDKNEKKEDSQHSRKREYADDSPELIEATYLWEKIKGNNPEHRKPDLQSWADDIRKMNQLDHRPFEKIHKMIDWCQIDTFWQTNILSASKLRSKYDTMAAQANRPYTSRRAPARQEATPEWMQEGYKAPKQEVSADAKAELAEQLKELEQLRSRNATSS
ncbi:replication protein [Lacticaseibacillus suilingensis]|uniref:Replication protein n=1 Tax=Lacticaseibacillus suilingensis TaxID=2799577 RepID=A0ABW4BHF9_9LACO|nr:replication protein [Lacticaseibacillus suilingensis]